MSGPVVECGGCGSGELYPFFDMGRQPVPEGASAGKLYPLQLVRCADCGLVQLDYIVPQEELFAADHPYSTGNSAALRDHYVALAHELGHGLGQGLVVDIGANDGTLLSYFEPSYRPCIAVEPTSQGLKCGPDVTLYQEFFTAELASRIYGTHGPAKVITACNVLAHVPDVHDFLDGVAILLDDDGLFVTENHDLYSVIDGTQLDAIYHEHLRYYSAATLSRLLEQHGLRVERIGPVDTHGGSFRAYARKSRGGFPGRAKAAATALRGMLWKITEAEKRTVYGIGACTRATPLIHYAGIAPYLACVCEVAGSDKIGQVMPGTSIPVVDERMLFEEPPDYALLFAWHMKDVIVPKLRKLGYEGKFIVPLPSPEVLDADH